MQKEEIKVTVLDVRIAVAILICCLTTTVLKQFGIVFEYNGMTLEVIQTMTACITCLLCCQDNEKISFKSGVNRLIITAIGGGVGILVVFLDDMIGNKWFLTVMIALGIVLTLFLCKAAKVPYINARIGGVTFVLVTCTLSSSARIWYAVFRLVSTFYGVLAVLIVTFLFGAIRKMLRGEKTESLHENG